ncbi:uncharacterized protein MELLADRAFT_102307 [Melampsora larici-populina 98AG31]|uniref:Uncharacterized protein n=1 Tax=Melampsora larici-populina (strain 98AG31 / pathotype 3-4-7) TaxID=747676 RepID=F4R7V4_MELLP|nr:uncharacterized protein MELLADRAFT_102307 [Melampsora larici-populina 98AG31]EGG11382.1 hypothetical protein MELLADRAFT_102307 [Melampsora larici-populina 98AG31]
MARGLTKKSHLLEEDELVVHLGDSVLAMYSEWNMKWEFHVDCESKPRVMIGQATTVTPHSGSAKWKTITVGRWMEIKKLLEAPGANIALTQAGTTLFETSKRPSIDITHLVFRSKRSGKTKHLYVQSNILTKFEYFQKCHSAEYSETQPADDSQLKMKGCSVEDSESQKVDGSQLSADQTGNNEGVYWDDSDDGWDSDSDNAEPEELTGQVKLIYDVRTILSKQPSMSRTPLDKRIEHLSTMQALETGRRTPWPEWAESHCTPHGVVPGFKMLSSPKSLYRLADMLIIPELKAICYKQIIDSLDVRYVISEIDSSVFQEHEELRVAAYKFMRKNWKSYETKDIASFIKNLSQEEAELVSEHILKNLTP